MPPIIKAPAVVFPITTRATAPNGASYHDQSGNTSSGLGNSGSVVGIRGVDFNGDWTLHRVAEKAPPISPAFSSRDQTWFDNDVLIEWTENYHALKCGSKVLVRLPKTANRPRESGYFWRLCPAADNILGNHGDLIWFHRKAWSDTNELVAQDFVVWQRSTGILRQFSMDQLSKEPNSKRRREIHACHQDKGSLWFMHERSHEPHYNASDFDKTWFRVQEKNSKMEITALGRDCDHPTFRNGISLFTGGVETNGKLIHAILDENGKPVIIFMSRDGYEERPLHICLDGFGNIVVSMEKREKLEPNKWSAWLEFEIRVYRLSDQMIIAKVRLHQDSQSEAGNNFGLLSRPFASMVRGLGYCVFYHEPDEADWIKPLAERRAQCWVAVFSSLEDETEIIRSLQITVEKQKMEIQALQFSIQETHLRIEAAKQTLENVIRSF